MARPVYWTQELLQKTAKKYKTMGEFRELDNNAYQAAKRQKVLHDITTHMVDVPAGRPVSVWTLKAILKEARTHKTLNDFMTYARSAYVMAHRKGWMEDVHKVFDKKQGGRG